MDHGGGTGLERGGRMAATLEDWIWSSWRPRAPASSGGHRPPSLGDFQVSSGGCRAGHHPAGHQPSSGGHQHLPGHPLHLSQANSPAAGCTLQASKVPGTIAQVLRSA